MGGNIGHSVPVRTARWNKDCLIGDDWSAAATNKDKAGWQGLWDNRAVGYRQDAMRGRGRIGAYTRRYERRLCGKHSGRQEDGRNGQPLVLVVWMLRWVECDRGYAKQA